MRQLQIRETNVHILCLPFPNCFPPSHWLTTPPSSAPISLHKPISPGPITWLASFGLFRLVPANLLSAAPLALRTCKVGLGCSAPSLHKMHELDRCSLYRCSQSREFIIESNQYLPVITVQLLV